MIATQSSRPTENPTPTTATTTQQPRPDDVPEDVGNVTIQSSRPTENPKTTTATTTTHQPRPADVPEDVDDHPEQQADRDLVHSEVFHPTAHKEHAGVEEDYRVGYVDQDTD